ncbi:hypothetical protein MMC11_006539 [Xylographa trunciseda]|nr:hypothetical protein [Xylographa trunciseda]
MQGFGLIHKHPATPWQLSSLEAHRVVTASFIECSGSAVEQELKTDLETIPKTWPSNQQYFSSLKAILCRVNTRQEFHFVTVKGPNKQNDRESRTQVRSYLMRSWHKHGDAGVAQVAARETQIGGVKGRFRLNTGQTRPARAPRRPGKHLPAHVEVQLGPSDPMDRPIMSKLAAAEIDPFNSLPISNETPSTEAVLQMYFSGQGPSWCPVRPESGWFVYALEDEALLHATIFHQAMYFCKALPGVKHDYNEIWKHQTISITLINERLGNENEATTDATIAAVACLASGENSFGTPKSANVHMSGLEEMIRLRGGLQNLGMQGLLNKLVIWADQCNAAITSSGLRFNTAYFSTTDEPPSEFSIAPPEDLFEMGNTTDAPQQSPVLQYLNDDIWKMFEGLSRLTVFINAIASPDMSRKDRWLLGDKLDLVERRLIASANIVDSLEGIDDTYRLVHASCRLAAIVHIHTTMRECANTNHVVANLVQRLRSSLLEVPDLRSAWSMVQELLLWVLFVGGIATIIPEERTWFVEALVEPCATLRVQSWDGVSGILKTFFWIDKVDDNKEFGLWQEVSALMSVRRNFMT